MRMHQLALVVNSPVALEKPGFDSAKLSAASYINDVALHKPSFPMPKVTAPGPSIPSITMKSTGMPGLPGMGTPKGLKAPTMGGSDTTKKATDATIPVIAGGVGGLGGWALNEKILKPILASREGALAASIAKQQQRAKQMAAIKPYLPLGASIVGALLLAGLAAAMARRNNAPQAPVYAGPGYDPYGGSGGSGYVPNEREMPGQYWGG